VLGEIISAPAISLEERPEIKCSRTSRSRTVSPYVRQHLGDVGGGGWLDDQRPRMFDGRRGHCLTGPIAVRGAKPGDVLAVHIVSAVPGEWGWTVAGAKDNALNRALGLTGAPTWLLWEIDADAGTATNDRGHTVGTSPFLGVIGMPPDERGLHSTITPRAAGGGNIDCRDLTAGATLFLPVTVPGALVHLGDAMRRKAMARCAAPPSNAR
jgi:acetamidase/formamidase